MGKHLGRIADALWRLPAVAMASVIVGATLTLAGAWLTAVLLFAAAIAAAEHLPR